MHNEEDDDEWSVVSAPQKTLPFFLRFFLKIWLTKWTKKNILEHESGP